MNSKQKGSRGERELAKKLKEYGYDCRRSVQYCGANGDADVVGLDGIHIECKRVERLNIQDAMSQAIADCKEDMPYRDWETDRKSTRLNSSHSGESRMPSAA